MALGEGEKQIGRWRRRGALQPTAVRGFYVVTDLLFEWVQRSATATRPHPSEVDVPKDPADSVERPPQSDPPPSPTTNELGLQITQARAFVAVHHRHLGPPVSGLFAVGVAQGSELVGVAIVGRPVARDLQDG